MKILLFMSLFSFLFGGKINHNYLDNQIDISISEFKEEANTFERENYYNGEKKEEIINKINRYLKSNLNNKGEYIVNRCLDVGLDPYLYTAVVLQETGCYWGCSRLVRTCNNVAGNKGYPACNGGSYRKFNTIEDGIDFSIKKLNSYYTKKGLHSAIEINPYYATDNTWYKKVNGYIEKLKK